MMERIIVHWTAGAGRASDLDREHYHRLVEFDGTVLHGTEAIEDNIVTSDGDYAAHTLRLNTGSIGVALCGMRGAKESPFHAGPDPLTEVQFDAACRLIADLALAYGIPISRRTILTHAEVQPTLGVRQRGKWDISRLPWLPNLRGAIPVGDYIRSRVKGHMGDPVRSRDMPLLVRGNSGSDVSVLQRRLVSQGAQIRIDGQFGPATERAVLQFQTRRGLETDGMVGPVTWGALA